MSDLELNTLDLEIQGMSCGHCVAAVSEALSELDGVRVENVQIGSANVQYRPDVVSPDQIVTAIEDAGYSAQTRG